MKRVNVKKKTKQANLESVCGLHKKENGNLTNEQMNYQETSSMT